MKALRRVLIGIIVVFVILGIFVLIDISSNDLLRHGAMKYISISVAIIASVFTWKYIDRLIELKFKK